MTACRQALLRPGRLRGPRRRSTRACRPASGGAVSIAKSSFRTPIVARSGWSRGVARRGAARVAVVGDVALGGAGVSSDHEQDESQRRSRHRRLCVAPTRRRRGAMRAQRRARASADVARPEKVGSCGRADATARRRVGAAPRAGVARRNRLDLPRRCAAASSSRALGRASSARRVTRESSRGATGSRHAGRAQESLRCAFASVLVVVRADAPAARRCSPRTLRKRTKTSPRASRPSLASTSERARDWFSLLCAIHALAVMSQSRRPSAARARASALRARAAGCARTTLTVLSKPSI